MLCAVRAIQQPRLCNQGSPLSRRYSMPQKKSCLTVMFLGEEKAQG